MNKIKLIVSMAVLFLVASILIMSAGAAHAKPRQPDVCYQKIIPLSVWIENGCKA